MNEQEFYRDVIQRKIVDDNAVRRAAKTGHKPAKTVLRRALVPTLTMLASLLLVFSIAMTIPSARAEVLQWFAPTSAQEYLEQDPEEREPNEELDAMIVPALQQKTEIDVNYVVDEPIFQTIAEHLDSVELGDTLFDGNVLYLRMRMDGLAALGEVEEYTGGTLTKTVIPPEKTPGYFEDNRTPEEFLSGEIPLYMEAEYSLVFSFPDGAQFYGGWLDAEWDELAPLVNLLRRDDLHHGWYNTPEQYAAVNERELAYLENKTVSMVSSLYISDDRVDPADPDSRTILDEFRARADENGIVTVTVNLQILRDHGNGLAETTLDATLGEVTVDLNAYKSLKKTKVDPGETKVVFAPEQTYYTVYDWDTDENGNSCAVFTNEPIDLNGLTLEPIAGGCIDALGIQNLRIKMAPPEGWSAEMLEQVLTMFLSFDVQINGQDIGYLNHVSTEVRQNGTVTFTVGSIDGVPLDMLGEVKTITLIPNFEHCTVMRVYEKEGRDLYHTLLEETTMEPGVRYQDIRTDSVTTSFDSEYTAYPQYAITFTVN